VLVITPRRWRWAVRYSFVSLSLLGASNTASAQRADHSPNAATAAEVVAGNILIGGLTAATRAILSGNDPWKAFGVGALGGAVHIGGKHLALEPGAPKGWLGLAVASTGTSIISNAGRGVSPFDELSIPIASARLRVYPGAPRRLRFVVNASESVLIASAFLTDGLEIDWTRTASSGAFVFETRGVQISHPGGTATGFAWGPVVVLDAVRARDADRVARHEIAHVYQHWFVAEAWARPVEDYLRRKLPGGRFVPSWFELGIADGAAYLNARLFGSAGLEKIVEAEAERLERR
jgi:hypothetical protein